MSCSRDISARFGEGSVARESAGLTVPARSARTVASQGLKNFFRWKERDGTDKFLPMEIPLDCYYINGIIRDCKSLDEVRVLR
jgi:hypothetical protein